MGASSGCDSGASTTRTGSGFTPPGGRGTGSATSASVGTTSDADLDPARAYAPMKRIATPEEIASAILYLASAEAGFVTGATWQLDGGSTAGH